MTRENIQKYYNQQVNRQLYIFTQEQAIQSIEISLRYCPSWCSICSEQFKCIRRNTNYYISKRNLCVLCIGNIQFKINANNCLDLILLMQQNVLQFQLVANSRLLIKNLFHQKLFLLCILRIEWLVKQVKICLNDQISIIRFEKKTESLEDLIYGHSLDFLEKSILLIFMIVYQQLLLLLLVLHYKEDDILFKN
ncbi:unnamed protein product [Paramecium pentaurelia]|uniref:Transmembrane protein n=1 Tax=Paramecium pentaurelia TaxID=43138 RepID=A0A8S1V5Y5_9CILI|nr:unnamed protein product [Paramecium pentaurelia]